MSIDSTFHGDRSGENDVIFEYRRVGGWSSLWESVLCFMLYLSFNVAMFARVINSLYIWRTKTSFAKQQKLSDYIANRYTPWLG